MRKLYLIIFFAVIAVVSLNIFFFFKFKKNIIDYQKSLVAEQVFKCGSYIEKNLTNYENDLTRILFNNNKELHDFFRNEEVSEKVIADLEGLYSKYRMFISNIEVFDSTNLYTGIYLKEDNDVLVINTYKRQLDNELVRRDTIIQRKGYYSSYFPFFKNNKPTINVVVEINLEKYLNSIFSLFKLKDLQWQWVANKSNKIIFGNLPDSISISAPDKISAGIDSEEEVVLEHYYTDAQGNKRLIISAVYPLNVLNNDLGIVFTIESGQLNTVFLKQNFFLILMSLLVMILLIFYIIYAVNIENNKQDKRSMDLLSLRMIVEHFPVGIMILDSLGTIKNINRTGQKMLFLEKDEDITGSQFASQFLVSNKYLLKEGVTAPFDSSHFIHYEKDGNETVIYRKDIKAQIAGEELTISALIDVSPLEKSRKHEAAANAAKSDFLAKMSHEIKTPMNGIIGMTENLLRGKLSNDQKEQVVIIQRSSDLLLALINDILDFSRIEAGKLMLEEIPFSLKDEIKISLELFKHAAEEKGLEIQTVIRPGVPDLLIGDPLRLRQVISNLVSNAIKFSQEGKIVIGVSLVERYNSTLNLLFYVEDTGVGIPKENLKKIFGTYEQGDGSVSRKYGGSGLGMAISKQLVELMNGQIWAESPSPISGTTKFPGSRFSFTIEAYSNEKLQKKFNFSHIRNYIQITALIVSKEKISEDNVHQLLDRFGINYEFRIYDDSNIDSVIYHVKQKSELYHMIFIMDKKDEDGFVVAQQLKASNLSEQFPLILISSNDHHGNYVRARTMGIDNYLIQPFESIEIYNILRENFPGLGDQDSVTLQVNKIRSDLQILIAEDNLINQRITQTIFKHLGYEIDIARNGLEAMEMISAKKYDIIFMDVLMPEMDGLTASAEIRKKGIKTPVIAISAADEVKDKKDALSAGMNDYISKPIRLESVKEILIKWFSESI